MSFFLIYLVCTQNSVYWTKAAAVLEALKIEKDNMMETENYISIHKKIMLISRTLYRSEKTKP